MEKLEFSWLGPSSDIEQAARFFAANVDARYISHSELQVGRASEPDRWSPDLEQILLRELTVRADHAFRPEERSDGSFCVLMREAGELRGLANLDFHYPCRAAAFCILEDIVVDRDIRGRGLGTKLFRWVEDACRARGAARLFFESGAANHGAHKLFEKLGCKVISHYFMKAL